MKSSPKIALFPGTFDPLTNGHLDVIRRGQALFDQLIVAIGQNPTKRPLFPLDERVTMARELMAEFGGHVRVEAYAGLTVDYARRVNATVILRGLRNVTDLHYEFQLALTNRAVADIETVFIMSGENFGFTSSSLIRQIAAGGELDRLNKLLPPVVIEALKQKKKEMGADFRSIASDGLKE